MGIQPQIINQYTKKQYNIYYADVINSTNSYAKELISKNVTMYDVVIANQQTAGYGKVNRTFISPANTGIYLSIIVPKNDNFNPGLLTTSTALVVAKTIKNLLHTDTTLKWVNDIMYKHQKVAGILIENINDYLVVGIGINYRTPLDQINIANVGTLAEVAHVSRNKFIAELLDNFFQNYQTYHTGYFLSQYRQLCETIGQNVVITSAFGKKKIGYVADINNDGSLLMSDGQKVYSGDVNKIRLTQ